ncbi:unnamed protein product [Camellia sinensis]
MTSVEKEKIRNAYDQDEDSAVIDAYAVLLMEEQDRLAVGVEFPDKSYVFSSICLDMLKNDNSNARDRFVLDNFAACKDCQYVHFLICFRAHWTLVLYDTETGVWKHYNSMRPRVGLEDKHLKETVFVVRILLLKSNEAQLVYWVMTTQRSLVNWMWRQLLTARSKNTTRRITQSLCVP